MYFVWVSYIFYMFFLGTYVLRRCLYGSLLYFVWCCVLLVCFFVYFLWFLVCFQWFSFVNFFFCVIPVESQRNAPCGPLGLGRCDDRCADFLPERRCRSGGRDCTDGYHTWCCIHRDDWTELCDANWYINRCSNILFPCSTF